MPSECILIIEDDPAMLRGLKDNLEYEGYRVTTATDGEAGLRLAQAEAPDFILLDIMLPKINGYEICRQVRSWGGDMPILMLTAKSQESDVVLGLNLGADDYMTKPFGLRELLARIQAQLRRRNLQARRCFSFGPFELDCGARRLTHTGQEITLTPKEFGLLELLCRQAGKALTRDTILQKVWGADLFVTGRSVDRCITTLRRKIEPDPENPTYIQTIREIGYRFDPHSSSPSS